MRLDFRVTNSLFTKKPSPKMVMGADAITICGYSAISVAASVSGSIFVLHHESGFQGPPARNSSARATGLESVGRKWFMLPFAPGCRASGPVSGNDWYFDRPFHTAHPDSIAWALPTAGLFRTVGAENPVCHRGIRSNPGESYPQSPESSDRFVRTHGNH